MDKHIKYPNIIDKNFNNKINSIFDEFTVPKKSRSFEEICYSTYEL